MILVLLHLADFKHSCVYVSFWKFVFGFTTSILLFLLLSVGLARGSEFSNDYPVSNQSSSVYHPSQQHRSDEAAAKARAYTRLKSQKVEKNDELNNYDVSYYELVLDVDPYVEMIAGTVTLKAVVLASSMSYLDLDIQETLQVEGIQSKNSQLGYSKSGSGLRVELDRVYHQGETVTLGVTYSGNPGSDYFFWDSFNDEPLVWTMSEPFGASYWWPCKDVNTDKADSIDLHITVPDNMVVASNGILNGITTPVAGKKTYHWQERYAIAPYLVSLSIHPYAEFSDQYTTIDGNTMEIAYYVIPSFLSQAERGYSKTADMLRVFAHAFGEYPFVNEKYGHAQVPYGGGMEHQTCSSLSCRGYSEGLISHELAHQWFGNLITCSDFHHVWLSEGLATWAEAYWLEYSQGPQAYKYEMQRNRYLSDGTIYVEETDNFSEIFSHGLSYNKASWVIHMLRHMLGDQTFFAGLLKYRETYAYSHANTEQFQEVFEAVSHRDLDSFFQQWIYGEYYPQYEYSWVINYTGQGKEVELQIDQAQSWQIFDLPLDIRATTEDGDINFRVRVDQQSQTFTLHVPDNFSGLEIDPNDGVLCTKQLVATSDLPNLQHLSSSVTGNAPNPFNPSTKISYTLSHGQSITIDICDLAGRRIKRLVDGHQDTGNHTVDWAGTNGRGQRVASGVYFVRLQADDKSFLHKMTLVQ